MLVVVALLAAAAVGGSTPPLAGRWSVDLSSAPGRKGT